MINYLSLFNTILSFILSIYSNFCYILLLSYIFTWLTTKHDINNIKHILNFIFEFLKQKYNDNSIF